jgi:hypothetical protein
MSARLLKEALALPWITIFGEGSVKRGRRGRTGEYRF